jgi:AraC-like DNA-binding protein
LAEAYGVSVRVLERLFLRAFGDPPRRVLKRLRMQRAPELLGSGRNVKETAALLGYEDPSHFSREFKKHYGLAPTRSTNPPSKTLGTAKASHSAMR